MHTIPIIWLALLLFVTPEPPPAVIVTLRATDGTPLAGVEVLAYDRGGAVIFGRALTDADGTARIAALPVGDIRVLVRGRVGGVELQQPGGDMSGVLVILGAPPTRLDLVVDADGTVRPDPATMIIPDSDTALLPITTAVPTPMTMPALVSPTTTPALAAVEPTTGSFPWFGIAIITILVFLLLAGLAWLSRARAQ